MPGRQSPHRFLDAPPSQCVSGARCRQRRRRHRFSVSGAMLPAIELVTILSARRICGNPAQAPSPRAASQLHPPLRRAAPNPPRAPNCPAGPPASHHRTKFVYQGKIVGIPVTLLDPMAAAAPSSQRPISILSTSQQAIASANHACHTALRPIRSLPPKQIPPKIISPPLRGAARQILALVAAASPSFIYSAEKES